MPTSSVIPLCAHNSGTRSRRTGDAAGSAPSPPCQGTGLRGQCQTRPELISGHPSEVGPKESPLQRRSCSNLGSPPMEGTGAERMGSLWGAGARILRWEQPCSATGSLGTLLELSGWPLGLPERVSCDYHGRVPFTLVVTPMLFMQGGVYTSLDSFHHEEQDLIFFLSH